MLGNFLKKNIYLWALLAGLFFLGGCKNDLLGLFRSNDLDIRLEERNNLKFIEQQIDNHTGFENIDLSGDYSFIVVNDIHIEGDDAFGLEKLAGVISDSGGDIKFVVATGDLTQGGHRQELEKFIEIADLFGVPCYPVIGNHDTYFNNWPHWAELIGSTFYKIEHIGAALFFLDSANACYGKYQLDWLESEIKKTNKRVLVFSHSNLFVQGPDMQQTADLRERARICSILKGRADAMFMGHVHKEIVNNVGGVLYLAAEDFRYHRSYYIVTVKSTGISYKCMKM